MSHSSLKPLRSLGHRAGVLVVSAGALGMTGQAVADSASSRVLERAKRIAAGGYMAPRAGCREVTLPGYEGLPTKRCVYRQGALKAEVILMDPDGPQLGVVVLFVQIGALCFKKPLRDNDLRQRHF